jgi:hypothetical protein
MVYRRLGLWWKGRQMQAKGLTKGLEWGAYGIRVEYDYTPEVRPFEESVGGKRIARRVLRDKPRILDIIANMEAQRESMGRIAAEADEANPRQPHWNNSWLPAVDAAILYTLVATYKPKTYLEVGSGNSTKFVRRAIDDHGLSTKIVSVDPQPRAEIDALCDEVIRQPIEKVDIDALAARLAPGDVVFVDNSHRGFQNSDVTICFLELMPALPAGTFFGVHDICLPFDYGPYFLDYFYNEQYYLGMYLLAGALQDEVVLPSFYACRETDMAPALASALNHPGIPEAVRGGSSFWMQLGAAPV